MTDEHPTKAGALSEYEPPALNNPHTGPTSSGMAYSDPLVREQARDEQPSSSGAEAAAVTVAAAAAAASSEKAATAAGAGGPDGSPTDPNTRAATPHAISVHPTNENQVVVARSLPRKSLAEAYILGIPLGMLGAHHFYLRRGAFGAIYLFTFGLFGMGWIADWFRMPCLVENANRKILDPKYRDKKSVGDAYILWFPFGLIGFHHYYLGNWLWGVMYTFTFGLCGVGWIIDAFRIPSLVKEYNLEMEVRRETDTLPQKRLCDAYILGATPLGLLGAHHYYLERYLFGVAYTLTFGMFGIGWLVDICRMPTLVARANKSIREGDDRLKYLDDAYVLCFPLGFLGLHHFYLHRYCWGFLYMCTFGLFGIGWMLDWCRLPWLVKDINEKIKEENLVVEHLRARMGPNAQIIVTESSVVVTNPTAAVNTVHDSVVANGATATGGTPTQHTVNMPTGANPQGQILQPPSYESVFGETPGASHTSQTLHAAGAGPSTGMPGVENVAFTIEEEKAGPLPTKSKSQQNLTGSNTQNDVILLVATD